MRSDKEYKHIDLGYITELADDDDDFVEQMIQTYLTSIPDNLGKFTTAIDSSNLDETLFYAHKLKGSFNFIGCTQVGEVFLQVESFCKEGADFSPIRACLAEITEAAAKVTKELEEALADIEGSK